MINIINVFNDFIVAVFRKGILSFFSVIALLCSIVGFIPSLFLSYIHFIVFILVICIVAKGRTSFNKNTLLLLLYIPFSLLLSQPDPVFQSWSRYVIFAVLLVLASPLIENIKYAQFRRKVLCGFLAILTIVAVASFFCYFLGINMMKNQSDGSMLGADFYMVHGGAFAGLFEHSIVLGWACGLSILYCLYKVFSDNKKPSVYWFLIFILFICILFSASRSALFSTFGGAILLLMKGSRNSGKLFKTITVVSILITVTFPLWEGALSGIQDKNERNEGKLMNSRTNKWECRMDEFTSSPVIGIGFASVDPTGNDVYNTQNGQIEPGNSWFAILAQIGIVGFGIILSLFYSIFKYLWRNANLYNSFLISLIIFFVLHFMAEGYGLASGSVLCFTAWLVLGCANDVRLLDKYGIKQ